MIDDIRILLIKKQKHVLAVGNDRYDMFTNGTDLKKYISFFRHTGIEINQIVSSASIKRVPKRTTHWGAYHPAVSSAGV